MTLNWEEDLNQAIDHRFEEMRSLRRWMHANPELSGQEHETTVHLSRLLEDTGFQVRTGPDNRGVIADPLNAATDVKRIAVRADIDALGIHDAKQVDYRSQRNGIMHACGHDAHTAIVFGALAVLRDLEASEQLPWPINYRGVFQPAEEICAGATEMTEAGALEGVASIMAVHMDPSRRVGRVGIRHGMLTANCDEMTVVITGRGGHAARPHETIDPISAAAQLINAYYLNIPRVTDSQDAVVVSIGRIRGGENANVIPEDVELFGTVRTLHPEVRRETFDHIRSVAAGIAHVSRTRIEVSFGLGCAGVDNDPRLVRLLERSVESLLGPEGVEPIERPSMGSEDFACYLEHVPGAMIRLGCSSDHFGGSPLHTPGFDIDEQTLRYGAYILARTVIDWSNPTSDMESS